MRKGRNNLWGCVAIISGVVIFLALILPTEFWWFILAAILIAAGIWFLRSWRYRDMKVYIFKLPKFLSRLLRKLGVR